MDKLLTISVAAYNGAETLPRALDSCLIKNMDLLEVFVIDDGSTDATAQIAAQYAAQWPDTFYLLSQSNQGYGSTINRSLSQAHGRFFRTLDCDDLFEDGSLQELLDYLKNCESDVVYTDYCTESRNGRKTYAPCKNYDPGCVYTFSSLHHEGLCIEMHALTFRTITLRESGIVLPNHCSYTDMLYTFYGMAAAETISFCPILVYRYQLGRDGQTVSLENYQRHSQDYIRVALQIAEMAEPLADTSAKGGALRKRASAVAQQMIELFLRFPLSKTVQKELKEYDQTLLRRFPSIAREIRNKNTILLRFSNYHMYLPLHIWAKWKKD